MGGATPSVSRQRVYAVDCLAAGLLVGVALTYASWGSLRARLPESFGPVPLAIPWFGAVGGVMVSFRGVFSHVLDWEPSRALRHYVRPFTAGVIGLVAYLMFAAGVDAVTQTPELLTNGRAVPQVLGYTVAFVIGYREDHFRLLIERVADSLLRTYQPGRPGIVEGDRPEEAKSTARQPRPEPPVERFEP